MTYVLTRYVFWRTKAEGVPKVFGPRMLSALGKGLAYGVGASLVGVCYLYAIQQTGLLSGEQAETGIAPEETLGWVFLLAVVAAPLFEEFIFRGLVFGGLSRSMGALPAVVASAAIFAIVHPPVSVLPVFALGVLAAMAYRRTRLLIAPMLTHAVYNASVIGYGLYSAAG